MNDIELHERITRVETRLEHIDQSIHSTKEELKEELGEFRKEMTPYIADVNALKSTKVFMAGAAAGVSTLVTLVVTGILYFVKYKNGV